MKKSGRAMASPEWMARSGRGGKTTIPTIFIGITSTVHLYPADDYRFMANPVICGAMVPDHAAGTGGLPEPWLPHRRPRGGRGAQGASRRQGRRRPEGNRRSGDGPVPGHRGGHAHGQHAQRGNDEVVAPAEPARL